MQKLNFIGGEKGGVGKSVVSRLLAQYFIDKQLSFKAYDADLSHGAMMRYYTAYSQAVDLADDTQADSIIEQMLEEEHDVIIDLAAQTQRKLEAWVQETGVLELCIENGIAPVFWHVMDDGSDAINLLENLVNTFGEDPAYVVVKNSGRGSDFSRADHFIARQLEGKYKLNVIKLPALNAAVMRKIDQLSASFWAAANNADKDTGPILGLLERQRVKVWLHKAYREFDLL